MSRASKHPKGRESFFSPEELFEQYRKGDMSALGALYDLLAAPLYSFAVRLLGSRHGGEDAIQELWCRALLHQEEWRAGTSVKSWLFVILRNLCFDLLRKRKSEGEILIEDYEGQEDLDAEGETPLAAWYRAWNSVASDPLFLQVVENGLQCIPAIYRVLLLYVFEGWSYAEMAEKENILESQVKGRLHRAREQLKEYLAQHGYEPDPASNGSSRKRERHE